MRALARTVIFCVFYCFVPGWVSAERLDGEYVGVTKIKDGLFVQCTIKASGDKLELLANRKTMKFEWDDKIKAWKTTGLGEVNYARIHGSKPFGDIWVIELEQHTNGKKTEK